MLFNSPEFLFGFLPVTLLGLFMFAAWAPRNYALGWLTLCSVVFYGWFKPVYALILFVSIGVNHYAGEQILRSPQRGKFWLAFGILFNLGLLGYYKYANFVADTLSLSLPEILLPIGISFFTFQQIAYLMDCRAGLAHRSGLLKYSLFVVYFPQLIAGPIVHPNAVLPQFDDRRSLGFRADRFLDGLTIFILGLGKKVILADALGVWASEGVDAVSAGESLTFFEAWIAVISYTLQIYFDFSGYSDMAIGLGRMIGISLPVNFDSPYRAGSIIEFWRRWHITLSSFLRDYLYIPLGGNRRGRFRRWFNLFITMLLGGLWHGAGWNFVLWGGLHGLLLAINHGWIDLRRRVPVLSISLGPAGRFAGWFLTMMMVMVAWVFFRTPDLDSALAMLKGMSGVNGVALPQALQGPLSFLGDGVTWTDGLAHVASGSRVGLAQVTGFLLLGFSIAVFGKPLHRLSPRSRALLLIPVVALTLQKVLFSSAPSEFLYFQF